MGCRFNEKKWNENFLLAKAYYKKNGNLNIPKDFRTLNGVDYDPNGILLKSWVDRQQQMCLGHIPCTLPPKCIKKLATIGIPSKSRDDIWYEQYEIAKARFDATGDLKFPVKFRTFDGINYDPKGYNMSRWVYTQRQALVGHSNCSLDPIKILKLRYFGNAIWPRTVWDDIWEEWYELAKKYYEHYGDLDVPENFKTINGYDYDPKGKALGNWISTQRQAYKNGILSKERVEKLELIDMRFDDRRIHTPNMRIWNIHYELAKKYREHYGHVNIPQRFKTVNGIDYDANGFALGRWYHEQKARMNGTSTSNIKLTKYQIRKLQELEADLSIRDNDAMWEEKYQLAKNYYEHYGHLNIPVEFRTKNGFEYDEYGVALGQWLRTQKQAYYGTNGYTLSEERYQKLLKIGMNFEKKRKPLSWEEMYALAKEYYEHYGNLDIPFNFRTKNGYDIADDGHNIGRWLGDQNMDYGTYGKKMDPEKIKLLEDLNIDWFRKNSSNKKLQCEPITEENFERKTNEITNRFYSVLYKFDEIPTTEEFNNEFIKQLSYKKGA